jgi:3D (Asp-Asp-Asp) domain-containing protein
MLAVTCAAHADPPEKQGRRVMITYYWLVDETRYHGKQNAELRDIHGNVIAKTTRRFKRELVREGTGWLRDGRTVMFEKRVGGESRFRITKERYGLSSTGCPLVPYRTIAVDPHVVKLGSRVFIPQFKGAKLPDGTIHDGMFIANDYGHFRGRHIDIFTGGPTARSARPFTWKGYHSRAHVTLYVVEENGRHDCW